MAKRHDKGEEISRGEIVSAAESLFALRGVERSSLADIAAAAGISKGTLNYYYASKELLVLDAAQELVADLTRVLIGLLPSLTRETSGEQARALLAEHAFPDGSGGLFAARLFMAFFHEAEMGSEALRALLLRSAQKWRAALEVGVLRARAPLGDFCAEVFGHICVAAARRIAREWE